MKYDELENQKKLNFCENLLKNEVLQIIAPIENFYSHLVDDFEAGKLHFSLPPNNEECRELLKKWNHVMSLWTEEELIDIFSENYSQRFYEDKSREFYYKEKEDENPLPNLTNDIINAMTHEERISALNPPAYVPAQSEIELRKYHYFFEDILWDILHYFGELFHLVNNVTDEEKRKSDLNFAFKATQRHVKSFQIAQTIPDSKQWINTVIDDGEWFNAAYVYSLSDEHGGDCTYIACSCMRCHAESRFGLNSTVRWGGAVGFTLTNLVYQERKRQREEKEKNALLPKQ